MGSGDLNLLKSWNPKLVKNREKVWIKEQELLKENEILKQKQLEITKERELDSLVDPHHKHKNSKKNGLEWMYSDPTHNEDYLLGKKSLDSSVISKNNLKNDSKVDSKIDSEQTKKFDYSNDDPMSKFKIAKKRHIIQTKEKISKPTSPL
ncbi:hypothetical protein Kpol_2000p27 [Vanderwaltozyma polyspora DSM 70294]|uniref:Pre-mRNA-splicing factor CWC25 n=1 Tax=Vanderwaltozyma polyspora (strain ATCC 22028 / DSM 70294 / BCRC 21397 / CBS 2163 / NBRC 10782 / NRRL Y-8283 / UCD 57-17) TaxID=436907 RepID=A7TF38_VANPO|nr:uncharacterized protein Kpol_2000p27 [Vanderwaltozyma polyspora DSM 70294]EDO19063.1 hypothetical protein Kpol_2000p27 [Vanderwaltozyma polyspora DSM 70294]